MCQHVLATGARQADPSRSSLSMMGQSKTVPGETQDAIRPGQRRETKEGRGDGKVVFRGKDGNLSWGSGNPLGWGLGFQSADEPILHFMVQS